MVSVISETLVMNKTLKKEKKLKTNADVDY